jgi:hypothetical protein
MYLLALLLHAQLEIQYSSRYSTTDFIKELDAFPVGKVGGVVEVDRAHHEHLLVDPPQPLLSQHSLQVPALQHHSNIPER